MSVQNFIPKIWIAKIMRTLEDVMVARQICNTSYEGEIKTAGDTVIFSGLADPTINDYTGTITYEDLQDASVEMKVDQKKYFAFKVGDIEKAQMNVDAKGSQSERAAYGLQIATDQYVLGKYASAAGGTVTNAAVTSANILSTVASVIQKLEEQNVKSKENRWIVVPPWVKQKLLLAGVKFQIKNGINGANGLSWTDELDIQMYVSNQVPNLGTAIAPQSEIMAGSSNALVYADQIIETEALRLQDSFSNAVRGLHVYGAKVLKPKELVLADLTYAAETTI